MNATKEIATDAQPVSARPLNSIELMKAVMRADEAMVGRCLRGTTNWAAAIGRAVQDAVLAAQAPQQAAPAAPQPTNTKTHDLLSTMIGMFLGFKEKIGYKPGSVIDKVVAEAVEHLKDWPYPEPAPKAPQQAAPAVAEKFLESPDVQDESGLNTYYSRELVLGCIEAALSRAAPQQEVQEPSPTAGMNIAQRILHVGGRNNAAGYVEFGSIQAVEALVRQVLRDLPATPTPAITHLPSDDTEGGST